VIAFRPGIKFVNAHRKPNARIVAPLRSKVLHYRPVAVVKRKAELVIAVIAERVAARSAVVIFSRILKTYHMQFERCTRLYSAHPYERLQRTRDKFTAIVKGNVMITDNDRQRARLI